MHQLDLPGMPKPLFACTPSRLAAFEDCPRRYRMTYLDRPRPTKGAPWAHNSVGAAVHNALRAWWELPVVRRTVGSARQLIGACWLTEGFRDDEQAGQARERAVGWTEDYLAGLDPAAEPVGVERTVGMRTGALAFSGRIDRLDERDGELVVVDYKTGRTPLTTDDARGSRPLALYALAAGRTLRKPAHRVELHHLPTGTVAAWEHDDEGLARHVRRAEDTAADIVAATGALTAGAPADEAFPPRPDRLCAFCDYRRHCPEGRAAGPGREPWAALALASD